jgi:indole-3-glycerol phosphate synthase
MRTIMRKPALEEIIVAKRDRLAHRKVMTPMEAMRALAGMQKRPEPMLSTVTNDHHVMLFGQIRYNMPAYDPVTAALRYARAGLDGIALFTDNTIYDGGINDLTLITRAVPVPVILQNYIFDEYQVVEARAAGASALTLVAGLMDCVALRSLISSTQRNRMAPIVRVQTDQEMECALGICPSSLIEVGRRDPLTGTLDIKRLSYMRSQIPSFARVLFYNRLRTFEEAESVAQLKPHAVLINDRLLAQDHAIERLHEIFAR